MVSRYEIVGVSPQKAAYIKQINAMRRNTQTPDNAGLKIDSYIMSEYFPYSRNILYRIYFTCNHQECQALIPIYRSDKLEWSVPLAHEVAGAMK